MMEDLLNFNKKKYSIDNYILNININNKFTFSFIFKYVFKFNQ